jgi:putative membrane protein
MMEILAGTVLGVALGTASGLVPGIHANTMAGILLSLQVVLLPVLGPAALAAAMFSALITHTFLDIIPSTFLGIPDADTALSVLPAHALCLEGKGEEAVRISALGSAYAVIIAVPLSVICFIALPVLQPFFDWWMGILLIGVMGYLIISGESPCWALLIFSLSGALGLFTMHFGYLSWHSMGGSAILMPLLTGLFGISVLLFTSTGPIPGQKSEGVSLDTPTVRKSSLLGTVAGIAVGWLPGLSTATANGVLATLVGYENNRRAYLLATGAANTANAFIGLAAFFALSRMRNGVIVAMASLEMPSMAALMAAGALAACIGYILTVAFAREAYRLNGIDGKTLSYSVIGVVTGICFVLTGPFGLFILLISTATGVATQMVNIRRVYCMGAVMVPVMLYSFGAGSI